MFYRAQKRTNYWSKIRKKAPKVPEITCADIDAIINQLEKLRKTNEQLRESGIYWHDACKEAVRDLLGKKQTR